MRNKRKRIVDILKLCGVKDNGIWASAYIHNIFTHRSTCEKDARIVERVGKFVMKNRRVHNMFHRIVEDLANIDWTKRFEIEKANPETLLVKLAICIENVMMLPGRMDRDECCAAFESTIKLRNLVLESLNNCYQYQEQIVRLCDMLDFNLQATQDIIQEHFA